MGNDNSLTRADPSLGSLDTAPMGTDHSLTGADPALGNLEPAPLGTDHSLTSADPALGSSVALILFPWELIILSQELIML